MRIIIAPDSFKECLTAIQVATAISEGIRRVVPEAEIISIPVADGGEGTVEAIVAATGGKMIITPSVDALNRPVLSFFGVLGDGKTAVIEMASASGIEMLTPEERNPFITSTFGTGLLIKAAIEAGFTQIILAIGGSATNDGGAGMAQALGFGLLDKNRKSIGPGGGSLGKLHSIEHSHVHPLLKKAKITVASDVRNPLLGHSGATRVYGPQKGATPEMLETLEFNMAHYSQILQQEFKVDIAEIPGTGAAGGLGAGLMAFCRAEMGSGFELINKLTHLEDHIQQASMVFTAEGKIDSQTAFGKTISGVAQLAKKYHVPVIALAGMFKDDLTELYNQGVTSVFAIGNEPMSLGESKARAKELLSSTSERIMRVVVNSHQNIIKL
ncbi:MAG: glycerate kinase [Prolixibacteraceae bacterium]|jgi:glycerate kinase|nr:glycerate kinase [Prolixibacteraceae bacterium]